MPASWSIYLVWCLQCCMLIFQGAKQVKGETELNMFSVSSEFTRSWLPIHVHVSLYSLQPGKILQFLPSLSMANFLCGLRNKITFPFSSQIPSSSRLLLDAFKEERIILANPSQLSPWLHSTNCVWWNFREIGCGPSNYLAFSTSHLLFINSIYIGPGQSTIFLFLLSLSLSPISI